MAKPEKTIDASLKPTNQKKLAGLMKRFEKVQAEYDEGTMPFKAYIHERFKLDEKIVTIYKKDGIERFNDEFYKTQISMFDKIIDGDAAC